MTRRGWSRAPDLTGRAEGQLAAFLLRLALAGVDWLVVVVDMSLARVLGVEIDMRDMGVGQRGMVMLVAVPGREMFERASRLAPVVRDVPMLVLVDHCLVRVLVELLVCHRWPPQCAPSAPVAVSTAAHELPSSSGPCDSPEITRSVLSLRK